MEVFVAILLLFGAFSLGSETNNDSADSEFSTTANEREDLPVKNNEAGNVEQPQWQDCLASRHFIIYRDLTVPYDNEVETNKVETEMIDANDSEEAYPDE